MLKYSNLRKKTAKARMWMICHVTALTVSMSFTSQAAVIREEEIALKSSPVGGAFAGITDGRIAPKGFDINAKFAEEAAESFHKIEEQIEKREMEQREQEALEDQAVQAAAALSAGEYEKELLASIIFCEAGNQSFTGQVAVGAVVMNRMASSAYPNTMEEVIYQSGQFSPAGSGWLDQVRSSRGYTESAMQAAEAALAGENPVGGCLYFDQGGYGMQIGAHYFH